MVIRWQDELRMTGWLERHRAKLTARDNEIPPIAFSPNGAKLERKRSYKIFGINLSTTPQRDSVPPQG